MLITYLHNTHQYFFIEDLLLSFCPKTCQFLFRFWMCFGLGIMALVLPVPGMSASCPKPKGLSLPQQNTKQNKKRLDPPVFLRRPHTSCYDVAWKETALNMRTLNGSTTFDIEDPSAASSRRCPHVGTRWSFGFDRSLTEDPKYTSTSTP